MFKLPDHGCYMFHKAFRDSIKLDLSPWRWGMACNVEAALFMACLAKLSDGPIFEFGTFTGRNTYNMALNTDHKIYTVDIGRDDDPSNERKYGDYVPGEDFLGKPEASRIELIIGDSREVDLSRLHGQMGLVFIDGGHTEDVVDSDTKKAFDLVSPRGLIVWDDYTSRWPGVVSAVCKLDKFESRMMQLEKDCQILYWAPHANLWWGPQLNAA